jgi:hypothetical protein
MEEEGLGFCQWLPYGRCPCRGALTVFRNWSLGKGKGSLSRSSKMKSKIRK